MRTKTICRVHRASTQSWISLVLPDNLSSKEDKLDWLEDACDSQFFPENIATIPADQTDQILTELAMKHGQDTDDPRRGNGGED